MFKFPLVISVDLFFHCFFVPKKKFLVVKVVLFLQANPKISY